MINKRFSAAATTYDRHARPQWTLAQMLVSMLPAGCPTRILELGSGTGQLTGLIAEGHPEAQIDAVDVAEQMVQHSQNKFRGYPKINWFIDDAQTFRAGTPYPLIVSSAALHWVDDLETAFRNIYQNLEPGGVFALGMMLEGTLGELHTLRSEIAPNKTPEAVLPSFEATTSALRNTGFQNERSTHNTEIIHYPDARAFLRAIHEQGVTGGRISTGSAPLNRTEINRLIKVYETRFTDSDGVRASYETGSFILRKPTESES